MNGPHNFPGTPGGGLCAEALPLLRFNFRRAQKSALLFDYLSAGYRKKAAKVGPGLQRHSTRRLLRAVGGMALEFSSRPPPMAQSLDDGKAQYWHSAITLSGRRQVANGVRLPLHPGCFGAGAFFANSSLNIVTLSGASIPSLTWWPRMATTVKTISSSPMMIL